MSLRSNNRNRNDPHYAAEDQDTAAKTTFLELRESICRSLYHYSSVFDHPCITDRDKETALNTLYGIATQHVDMLWSLALMNRVYQQSGRIGVSLIPTNFEAPLLGAPESELALYDEYARCIWRSRHNLASFAETMQTLAAIAKRHVYSRETPHRR